MNFENEYTQRVSFLLKEHDTNFDLALKKLLQNASAEHTLGNGNTIRNIMKCCSVQLESAIKLLIETSTEIIGVYEHHVSRKKVWNLISNDIDSLINITEEKKLKAIKTAQGSTINERIIEASSLNDKYQLFKSEAGYSLDKALAALREKRGKTLKDRLMYRLNNNWAYLIIFFAVGFITWLTSK